MTGSYQIEIACPWCGWVETLSVAWTRTERRSEMPGRESTTTAMPNLAGVSSHGCRRLRHPAGRAPDEDTGEGP
jgi:hypothetical protein